MSSGWVSEGIRHRDKRPGRTRQASRVSFSEHGGGGGADAVFAEAHTAYSSLRAVVDSRAPTFPQRLVVMADAKKVLLVDDDDEIVETVRYALEAEGYDVVVARDGNQGLALSEREDPDLMILDMMMPKRSGFLVLEKIRRVRSTPLPVIMITGNEGSRHKAYAELLGVNDYLRKPFEMPKLMASVKRLLAGEGA